MSEKISGIWIAWQQPSTGNKIGLYPMPIEHIEPDEKFWSEYADIMVRELPGGKGDWEYIKSKKVFRADKPIGGR